VLRRLQVGVTRRLLLCIYMCACLFDMCSKLLLAQFINLHESKAYRTRGSQAMVITKYQLIIHSIYGDKHKSKKNKFCIFCTKFPTFFCRLKFMINLFKTRIFVLIFMSSMAFKPH